MSPLFIVNYLSMKKIKLTFKEYYEFVQIAKFAFATLGVSKGTVIVEANMELLNQLGFYDEKSIK